MFATRSGSRSRRLRGTKQSRAKPDAFGLRNLDLHIIILWKVEKLYHKSHLLPTKLFLFLTTPLPPLIRGKEKVPSRRKEEESFPFEKSIGAYSFLGSICPDGSVAGNAIEPCNKSPNSSVRLSLNRSLRWVTRLF